MKRELKKCTICKKVKEISNFSNGSRNNIYSHIENRGKKNIEKKYAQYLLNNVIRYKI